MLADIVRKKISRHLTGQDQLIFQKKVPGDELIEKNIADLDRIGLYLHIPFCNQICPYCPYNKEIIRQNTSSDYTKAVIMEIQRYASMLAGKPVSSFYIGGGTPTTMLGKGIENIIAQVYTSFNMQCSIHMESHPNHLSAENLNSIETLGVKYLSIGVESFQDKHLRLLERTYTVSEVKKNIERAVGKNFECVNIDYIFDLPGQTFRETEEAANDILKLGVHQTATYPLFSFPFTRFGKETTGSKNAWNTMLRRRKFLKILEDVLYSNGFDRSSVWAFTKKGTDKYCSVTVPSYIGIGASGGTYLKDIFYVNTFNVTEYNKSLLNGNSTVALSIDLSEKAQMASWLYWRIYETKFRKSDFLRRFNTSFDAVYGSYMKLLKNFGFLVNGDDLVTLTDRGTYWIHAFEDFFSIDYINKLWGASGIDPWPEKVLL